MYYLYILKSLHSEKCYIGSTNNLVKRINDHKRGKSFSTRREAPWKLVYLEGYANEEDARNREKKLKQFGRVYSQLKRRISHSLKS